MVRLGKGTDDLPISIADQPLTVHGANAPVRALGPIVPGHRPWPLPGCPLSVMLDSSSPHSRPRPRPWGVNRRRARSAKRQPARSVFVVAMPPPRVRRLPRLPVAQRETLDGRRIAPNEARTGAAARAGRCRVRRLAPVRHPHDSPWSERLCMGLRSQHRRCVDAPSTASLLVSFVRPAHPDAVGGANKGNVGRPERPWPQAKMKTRLARIRPAATLLHHLAADRGSLDNLANSSG